MVEPCHRVPELTVPELAVPATNAPMLFDLAMTTVTTVNDW